MQGRTQKTDSSVRTEVMTKMTVTDDWQLLFLSAHMHWRSKPMTLTLTTVLPYKPCKRLSVYGRVYQDSERVALLRPFV